MRPIIPQSHLSFYPCMPEVLEQALQDYPLNEEIILQAARVVAKLKECVSCWVGS